MMAKKKPAKATTAADRVRDVVACNIIDYSNMSDECIADLVECSRKYIETCEPMRAKLEKVAAWLDRLGDKSESQAKWSGNFKSLADALRADAKNYRATAADIRKVL